MNLPSADLGGCAAEPIRVPGAIQPHGWLAAVEAATGRVVAFSDNWQQLTGLEPATAQAAALQSLADTLRPNLDPAGLNDGPASIGAVVVSGRLMDATAHQAGPMTLLEFEAASPRKSTQAPIYMLAREFVPLLQKAKSVVELCSIAATRIKALTGFGRSLVYSFDREGHGEVLAEEADAGYDSYLGHRFPASDIPTQARELYLLNRIRLIPDANYEPSRLHFVDESCDARPLDLSFAHLRSVSPIHLEYMRNMGTLASMSVSIVVRGQLWGLISCHDHEPRALDFETRAACEHLGGLLSLQIEAKQDNVDVEWRHELRSVTMRIVSRLGESEATLRGLLDDPDQVLSLARASGVAVIFNEECWTAGTTPGRAQILALSAWIGDRGEEVYQTDSLGNANAPPSVLEDTAGLLAISLSKVHCHLVIWFRPAIVQSIRWAGEPHKQPDEGGRLHPRTSFQSWEEIVRGKSLPWAASEIAAVLELRQALTGIVLRRAQERTQAAGELGRALVAKNVAEQADLAKTHSLAILSHELRTPLGAIAAAAELLGRFAEIPEKFKSLVPMIKRNVALETRLIDDLLDMSSITAGKLNLTAEPVDMHVLVRQVAQMVKQDVADKGLHLYVELHATHACIMGDPVRMQQVLWNILRNAVKFTPQGGEIRISSELRSGDLVLTFTDSGIGIDSAALDRIFNAFEQAGDERSHRLGGLGLGLAIAMGLVQRQGGRLVATSEGRDRGATFTLSFPALPHA